MRHRQNSVANNKSKEVAIPPTRRPLTILPYSYWRHPAGRAYQRGEDLAWNFSAFSKNPRQNSLCGAA
jgi:hypothetical protein